MTEYIEDKIVEAKSILREAIEEHDPDYLYGAFSGGHDSLVATHLASQLDEFDGVFHADTGIGVEETEEFVEDVCDQQGWKLHNYSPQDALDDGYKGLTFEEFVKQYGFPGPSQHTMVYSYLKERPIRLFKKRVKESRDEDIMLSTGIRVTESERRMGNAVQFEEGSVGLIWASPIIYFDGNDVREYIDYYDLPENQVVNLLHMSGECLCGAFASQKEYEWIKTWYPEVAERIDDLEEMVSEAAKTNDHVPNKRTVWGWGQRENPNQKSLPMCVDCEKLRGGNQ